VTSPRLGATRSGRDARLFDRVVEKIDTSATPKYAG